MSSALTHEQCDLLRKVAEGRQELSETSSFNLQLLQRTGLLVEDRATRRLRVTEAGKRYVAFIERTQPAHGLSVAGPGSSSSFEAEPL